jgi:hypothetical protein
MMRTMLRSGFMGIALCAGAALGVGSVAAQTGGQASENAGHPTTNVAQQAGDGIKRGTTTAYHKTAHGTKKVYHKTGRGVANVGDKMQRKPGPQ